MWPHSVDEEDGVRLWDVSVKLVGLKDEEMLV